MQKAVLINKLFIVLILVIYVFTVEFWDLFLNVKKSK